MRSVDRLAEATHRIESTRSAPGAPTIVEVTAEWPVAEAAPAAPAEGAEPPVYPTRIALSTRLAYEIRRGALGGTGELNWQHDGLAYTLALSGSVLGLELLGQASRGGFDAAGLAPERFVDRRRGRDRQAANFDRSAGRITFSGPAVSYPLVPGAQDRLSWMVQLPAWTAGARVAMFIAGSRGDGDVRTFFGAGDRVGRTGCHRVVDALRLTRDPRTPCDTQIEVWLDPARQHLPARVRLTGLPGGETLGLKCVP